MSKYAKAPLEFASRSVHASLRVPVLARLIDRIHLDTDNERLPTSYEAKRIGVRLTIRGRWPVPQPVAVRLLQNEFDVLTHGSGCVSIPRPRTEAAPRSRKERRAGLAGLVRRVGVSA